jgi:hypothetical protein
MRLKLVAVFKDCPKPYSTAKRVIRHKKFITTSDKQENSFSGKRDSKQISQIGILTINRAAVCSACCKNYKNKSK